MKLGHKHVSTAAKFILSEHDWMRRWGTLDILAGRQQETSVHGELGKISLVPIRLRSGKLRSTSWWSILDVLDMSAHHGLHRNFQCQFYKRRSCGGEQRGTATLRTKKWCTGTWWRTVENEFWSRSHLTWWTCANLSWALLHWKHRGVTIIFNHDKDRIIFRN